MNFPQYVTEGMVLYCGRSGWHYVGKDPESGKPVLKDSVTKRFIVADESKISKPKDLVAELAEDIEMAHDDVAHEHNYNINHIDFMTKLAWKLHDYGYTDGTANSKWSLLGILSTVHGRHSSLGVHATRGDLEISFARELIKNNFKKTQIVLAHVPE